MPDPHAHPSLSLGDALRALPPPRPDPGGWTRLQAQLQAERARRPPRRRRRGLLLVLAATLAALAVLAPLREAAHAPRPDAAATATRADPSADELAALQRESAQLDRWRRRHPGDGVETADAAALVAQINDRIGWIDAALDSGSGDAAERALWQERVLLLRRLTQLETRGPWLAASEGRATAAPVLL